MSNNHNPLPPGSRLLNLSSPRRLLNASGCQVALPHGFPCNRPSSLITLQIDVRICEHHLKFLALGQNGPLRLVLVEKPAG